MSLLCCPVCHAPLNRQERTYRCPNGHCFDVSREGYVHLLPANRKHSKNPGDDKGMAAARNRFLSGDWYAPLKELLTRQTASMTGGTPAVLDSGCGEGYYTQGIGEGLRKAGKDPRVAGVDLSKASLRYAARRLPWGEFAVGSVYHLPVGDQSVDLLINCFSPLALEEFQRVLKPGGCLFYVVPGPRHLWELKEVLYEKPYPNEEVTPVYEGFHWQGVEKIESIMSIKDGQTLSDLFHMTPYYWKTPAAGAERLAGLDSLDITESFAVHCYTRD